ncbi:MAG TPA: N,N-dimethylformamidase beta subunit family domain-containing protein, partial [candidate division Zixibacteria bacterium]|nr:N,N-dimethylformamidase beta subunit family domain-containing protein [candidate division Zixibacteria bacterium]
MRCFSILKRFSIFFSLAALVIPLKSQAVIQAYAEISVAAGSQIHFRVKSNAENFRIIWYRYDLADSTSEKIDDDDLFQFESYRIPLHQVLNAGTFSVLPQADDDIYAYRDGCNWQITCTLDIPADWPSDFYLAKLLDDLGQDCFVPVIVRSSSPGSFSRIANVSATNTWQAYNTYGGASFYDCVSSACTTGSPIVSYDRPLPNTTPTTSGHLSDIEHLIIKFLKSHDVAYEQLSDRDLHEAASNGLLDNYDIIILSGHNEYWSAEMKEALEAFLDRGGKLINLSGNTMFWRIAFDGNKIGRVARWRVLIPGGEFGILGAGYLGANCCPVCAGLETRRTHWIFNNTSV